MEILQYFHGLWGLVVLLAYYIYKKDLKSRDETMDGLKEELKKFENNVGVINKVLISHSNKHVAHELQTKQLSDTMESVREELKENTKETRFVRETLIEIKTLLNETFRGSNKS